MGRLNVLASAWIVLLAAFPFEVFGDELPKVEAGKLPVPSALAETVRATIDPTSYAVSVDGKVVAVFWFRALVPTKSEKHPIAYYDINEGTLVAVVEIKGEGLTDFRDQALLPGLFTMRLGVQPQDGNHMGVAPFPEFLCLSPAALDKELANVDHDTLMEMSKKSLDTGHPVVLFLNPFADKLPERFPVVSTNESHHVVLNIQTKGTLKDEQKVDLPIGIVIVGITEA